MKKILCALLGHKWQAIYPTRNVKSVCHVCLRCRENGWLITP